jgi:hypothetical protein
MLKVYEKDELKEAGILASLQGGKERNRDSIIGMGKRFSFSPNCLDQPQDLQSLLFSGVPETPGVKQTGREADHSSSYKAEFQMGPAVP